MDPSFVLESELLRPRRLARRGTVVRGFLLFMYLLSAISETSMYRLVPVWPQSFQKSGFLNRLSQHPNECQEASSFLLCSCFSPQLFQRFLRLQRVGIQCQDMLKRGRSFLRLAGPDVSVSEIQS